MYLSGNDGLKKFSNKNTKSHVYNKAESLSHKQRGMIAEARKEKHLF